DSDIIGSNGTFSFKGISKLLVKILIFKLKFKKIIFVRHNFYPHSAKKEISAKAKNLVDKLEVFFDHCVVHSPVFPNYKYEYIPHPLYKFPLKIDAKQDIKYDNNKFVIFGRISSYKKYEKIIEVFPCEHQLLIGGQCDDNAYLNKIQSLVKNKCNVSISPFYLDDIKAKELINSTGGLIISHADDDMIVSGSFFYGLTLGIKMFAVATPFLKWAEEQFGADVIETFPNVNVLCERLSDRPIRERINIKTVDNINALFSDAIIANTFKKLCEK
uniref:hypothetical protein n=1 Tax=Klebsiella pneumoniae TaxID=573 RepID=UPI003A971146